MSLKEIAARTGVSVSTVSRVLNNRPGGCVSAQVRQRVWSAAREMGYQPNLHARNLKQGTSDQALPRVSVILARPDAPTEDPFFVQTLDDLSAELLGAGFRLGKTVCPEEGTWSPPEAEGYIVLGKCREDLLRRLEAHTPNLVGLWRNPGALPVDQVVCSGQKAASLAMEHLVELGHRRIAYIGDCSYENRFVGYTEALTGHGLPLIYPLVFNIPQTREDGQRAMEALLQAGEATGVLCASDEVALGALDALRHTRKKRGVLPVSVVSIDDIPEARRAGLTTVHIPRGDMAHLAVRLLADRMAGGHREQVSVELPCRLVERDSCYCVV